MEAISPASQEERHDTLGGTTLIEAQNDQSSLDEATTLQEHLVSGETVTIVTSSGDTVVQASTLATLQQHPPPQPPQGAGPPPASHSLQHLNKLASEQQQTLAGTLGHTPPSLPPQYPPSPVVIQPTGAGAGDTPTNAAAGVNSNSVLNMNGPLTPQSMPSNGSGGGGGVGGGAQSGQVTTAAQNGAQDVQNNNTVKVKSCAGCGARICDRFLLHAMERYWHTGCLKCSCCQAQLGEIGTTCYAKAGMILCKNDYIRLFGSSGTCSACGQSIPASEFVMRAQTNVYHLNCFTCVACNSRLVPGDRYSLFNGSLICEHDYPKVLKGHTQIPLRASHKVC